MKDTNFVHHGQKADLVRMRYELTAELCAQWKCNRLSYAPTEAPTRNSEAELVTPIRLPVSGIRVDSLTRDGVAVERGKNGDSEDTPYRALAVEDLLHLARTITSRKTVWLKTWRRWGG